MKYWKIIFVLITSFIASCSDDVDKIIETDLTEEAAQLYQLSLISHEHLFFSLYTWNEYQFLDGDSLPGCPSITLEENSKKVTLTFDIENGCSSDEPYKRSGKIILDLALRSSQNPEWYITFENYVFESYAIKGEKRFIRLPNGVIQESYSDLEVNSTDKLSYTYGALINHLTIREGFGELETVFSEGNMEGRNPAGRFFSKSNITPTISQASCFKSRKVSPDSGEETWVISRGSAREVNHQLSYDSNQNCETTASMLLPDGRKLILSP